MYSYESAPVRKRVLRMVLEIQMGRRWHSRVAAGSVEIDVEWWIRNVD